MLHPESRKVADTLYNNVYHYISCSNSDNTDDDCDGSHYDNDHHYYYVHYSKIIIPLLLSLDIRIPHS